MRCEVIPSMVASSTIVALLTTAVRVAAFGSMPSSSFRRVSCSSSWIQPPCFTRAVTGVRPTTIPTTVRYMAYLEENERKTEAAEAAKNEIEEEGGLLGKLGLSSKDLDVSNLMDNMDKIRENAFAGEFGSRGEAYFAAQAILVLCILGGGIPIVGDPLMFALGPGLLLIGLSLIVLSSNSLGSLVSPWPVPLDEREAGRGGLVTTGLYTKVRHPMYAGLLCTMAGFSILTGSAVRLLLTAALIYALDVKTDFEESKLLEKYPEYAKYRDEVKGKFFPHEIISILPWGKDE